LNGWTAVGILLICTGMFAIVFRRQELRDRQRLYDVHSWWSYPPVWREHAIVVLGALVTLALGIFVLVASLTTTPLSR
jgi:multisubunit Na+/H+ antiporter MnhB subunit